jgi:hypothetical protein
VASSERVTFVNTDSQPHDVQGGPFHAARLDGRIIIQ